MYLGNYLLGENVSLAEGGKDQFPVQYELNKVRFMHRNLHRQRRPYEKLTTVRVRKSLSSVGALCGLMT